MKSSVLQPRAWFSYDAQSSGDNIRPELIDLGTGILATPQDASRWRWRYAKLVIQCAEFNDHELRAHLAEKHLVTEVFIVETMKMWRGTNNIVYRLLVPHFSRTLAVNQAAKDLLIAWLGTHLSALSSESLMQFVEDSIGKYDCDDLDVERELKGRGFDLDHLPPSYFYAQDSLRLWRILLEFITNEIMREAFTINWPQIQAWANAIKQRLPSFCASELVDVKSLARTVTGVIFNASVSHSAFNDGQYFFFGFTLSAPGRFCRGVPQAAEVRNWRDSDWKKCYFDSLPRTNEMLFQRDLVSILSLNAPDNSSLIDCLQDYRDFLPKTSVDRLQEQLRVVTKDILDRGDYKWLAPGGATRSVIR